MTTINTTTRYAEVSKIRSITKMCPTCMKLHTSLSTACTKCGGALTTPYSIKDGEKRYYAFDEVHFDLGDKSEQKSMLERVKSRKSVLFNYLTRMYYRLDKEKNAFMPDKRIAYLPPGRKVILTWHKDIDASMPYINGAGQTCMDMPIIFDDGDKQAIQFLPEEKRHAPKAATPISVPAEKATSIDPNAAAMAVLGIDANQLATLKTILNNGGLNAIAPATTSAPQETMAEQRFNEMFMYESYCPNFDDDECLF